MHADTSTHTWTILSVRYQKLNETNAKLTLSKWRKGKEKMLPNPWHVMIYIISRGNAEFLLSFRIFKRTKDQQSNSLTDAIRPNQPIGTEVFIALKCWLAHQPNGHSNRSWDGECTTASQSKQRNEWRGIVIGQSQEELRPGLLSRTVPSYFALLLREMFKCLFCRPCNCRSVMVTWQWVLFSRENCSLNLLSILGYEKKGRWNVKGNISVSKS